MKAIHQRFVHGQVIFSKLTAPWINDFPDVYGIERPSMGNQHIISCIPAGIYQCMPHKSPSKGDCWQLINVPGRTDILIHPGNFASIVSIGGKIHGADTDGCLMYGFGIEENIPMITQSKQCIDYLYTTIGLKSEWQLDVRD